MGIKKYKPYTPSRRFMTGQDFSTITTSKPYKKLTTSLSSTGGRNNRGRITTRSRGGGHARRYRIMDWKGYDKQGVPGRVVSVEYDPNRNARIALISYRDGDKRYVLARKNVQVDDVIMVGSEAPLKNGCRKQLVDIPDGFFIHALEYTPSTKAKLLRSAGMYAVVSGRDEQKQLVYIKLPSGEVRMFHENCWATIGQVGNESHANVVIGKAGRSRRMGKRPHVLGKSMNPVDHPHGGGEQHTSIGMKYPKSFTGKPVPPGKKTRKPKKWSSKFIVSRRGKKNK